LIDESETVNERGKIDWSENVFNEMEIDEFLMMFKTVNYYEKVSFLISIDY
jgi:hypothetical protein